MVIRIVEWGVKTNPVGRAVLRVVVVRDDGGFSKFIQMGFDDGDLNAAKRNLEAQLRVWGREGLRRGTELRFDWAPEPLGDEVELEHFRQ